jgi:hypothetical protein
MMNFDEYEHLQELGDIVLTQEIQDRERQDRIFEREQNAYRNEVIDIFDEDRCMYIERNNVQTMDFNMQYNNNDDDNYDDGEGYDYIIDDYDTRMDSREEDDMSLEHDNFEIII